MEKEIIEVKLGQKLKILCNNRRSYTGTLEYAGTTERYYVNDYVRFVFKLISNESICAEELDGHPALKPTFFSVG